MEAIRTALLEDEPEYMEHMKYLLGACMRDLGEDIKIDCFSDYTSIERVIENNIKEYSMLVFDIDVNGKSGIDAARDARLKGFKGVLIFATSHNQYALDAYGLEALGYIEKPVCYDELYKLLSRALIFIGYNMEQEEIAKKFVEIKVGSDMKKIMLDKITYLEKSRNRLIIHTERYVYTSYESLKQVYKRLNRDKFVYCHEGIVVNFDKVTDVRNRIIVVDDTCELPISRSCFKSIGKMFDDRNQELAKAKGMTAPRFFS